MLKMRVAMCYKCSDVNCGQLADGGDGASPSPPNPFSLASWRNTWHITAKLPHSFLHYQEVGERNSYFPLLPCKTVVSKLFRFVPPFTPVHAPPLNQDQQQDHGSWGEGTWTGVRGMRLGPQLGIGAGTRSPAAPPPNGPPCPLRACSTVWGPLLQSYIMASHNQVFKE